MNLVGLAVVVLSGVLMVVFRIIFFKRPMRGIRQLPAFNLLRQAISLAVEDGSRLHISLGKSSVFSTRAAPGLVGLSVLERVAQLSSISDSPPIATSGDGSLAILSQDILSSTYRDMHAAELYDPNLGSLTGATPFSYVAGTLPVIHDEHVSANIFIGNFGPEAALLVDRAEQEHSFSMAASDDLAAQAVFYAIAREPLLGEELFASAAYLQSKPYNAASLRVQDVLRWFIIAFTVAGVFLKLAGLPVGLP
ncbi:MAG TPA: DUF6754 domain-containing protein [Anaerolineaceae bacterium]